MVSRSGAVIVTMGVFTRKNDRKSRECAIIQQTGALAVAVGQFYAAQVWRGSVSTPSRYG